MAATTQTATREKGTENVYKFPAADTGDTTISTGAETHQCTTGFNVNAKWIWGRGKHATAYLHYKTVTGSPVLTAVVNQIVGGILIPIPGARRLVKLSPDPNKLEIPFAMENLHPECTGTKITYEDVTMGGGSIKFDGTESHILVEV